MIEVRDAALPDELPAAVDLWRSYLTWANDELDAHFGFRLPVEETIEKDIAGIAVFQPPDGRLLLAFDDGDPVGTAALRTVRSGTVEIKRMFVHPQARRL